MESKRKRRALEAGKDVLIVLLSCSAVWLALRTPLASPLRGLFREEGPQTAPGQSQTVGRAEAAVPMAMAANLPGGAGLPEGSESTRYGAQYDQNACQELFQRAVGPLAETLSGAGTPERVERERWQAALTECPGVYMDFQGQIPIPVLAGWLSGGETALTATVRRLALVAREDGIDLYYRDEADGSYYRCSSQRADPAPLMEALYGLTDNGAFFAFESEWYEGLDPDTLLMPEAPAPAVYAAANPMNTAQASLGALVQDLGFSLNSTSFYVTDDQVARSGDDSVRLSDQGVVQYVYEGREGVGLFPVSRQGGELFDSVETCRQIALSAMGSRCGEARLYLLSARQTDRGLEIDFGYSLNGIPVLLDRGYAARFLVNGGQVVQFTMYLRSYTAGGETCLVLPPRQGAAVLMARGLEGEELLLTYSDSGRETVLAGWSAREAKED